MFLLFRLVFFRDHVVCPAAQGADNTSLVLQGVVGRKVQVLVSVSGLMVDGDLHSFLTVLVSASTYVRQQDR